jgi:hypothetical protein
MAASVSGAKTISTNISPAHPASTMTTILATAVENMTVSQLYFLEACLRQRAGGEDPNTVIGTLFS